MEGSVDITGSRRKKKRRHEAIEDNVGVKIEEIEDAAAHTPGPRKKKKRTNEPHVKSEAIGGDIASILGPEEKKRRTHEAVQRKLHDHDSPTENNRSVNGIEEGTDFTDSECPPIVSNGDAPLSNGNTKKKKKKRSHEAVQDNLRDSLTEKDRLVNGVESRADTTVLERPTPSAPEQVMSPSESAKKKKKRKYDVALDNLHDNPTEPNNSASDIENRGGSRELEFIPSSIPDRVNSPSEVVKKKKKRRHEAVQHNFHGSQTETNPSASGIENGGDPGGLERTPSSVSDRVIPPSEVVERKKKRKHETGQQHNSHDNPPNKDLSVNGSEGVPDPTGLESSPPTVFERVVSPSKEVKKKKKRHEGVQRDPHDSPTGKNFSVNDSEDIADPTGSESKEVKKKKKRHEAVQRDPHDNPPGKGGSVNGSEDISDPTSLESSPRAVPEQVVSPSKKVKKKKKRHEAVLGNPHDSLTEKIGITGGADLNGLTGSSPVDSKPVISPSKMVKKKKKVRFQLPGEDTPELDTKDGPTKEGTEDDMSQFSESRTWKTETPQDYVYGRYSKAEDEKIKESVHKYIKMKGWNLEEGIERVLHPRDYSEARGCWAIIAKCLPHRGVKEINSRASRIFKAHQRGKWSSEELELLEELQRVYISDWAKIEVLLGRDRQLCKDKWRKLRFKATGTKGRWTQEEYDNLSKLVRKNLNIKASLRSDKKFDARELRDNIDWEWIANKMRRDSARCADSWYSRLASPMLAEGRWANVDDRLLLQRLMEMAPTSEDAVDWDGVLEHRDGVTCRARWGEMSKLLRENSYAPFEQKLEYLATRHCPDLLGIVEDDVAPACKVEDSVPPAGDPQTTEDEPHS